MSSLQPLGFAPMVGFANPSSSRQLRRTDPIIRGFHMSKAIVLQHVEAEGPGRIVSVFRDFGIPLEIRRLHKGDEVPTDLDEVRCLIILGGPMGVSDIEGGKYPFLAREVEILKRMIQRDRP